MLEETKLHDHNTLPHLIRDFGFIEAPFIDEKWVENYWEKVVNREILMMRIYLFCTQRHPCSI